MGPDSYREDPWELILARPYLQELGQQFNNTDRRAMWCRAFFEGGNTLRLWNEATELKMAFLTACALHEGQRVLFIGKFFEESGAVPAVHSLIGQKGDLTVEDILPLAMASLQKSAPVTGKQLQWDFNYFDSIPDGSFDRVILFNAASHIGNLESCARHIHRTLRDTGRVIIAEAPWGSREMLDAARLDAHLYGVLIVTLAGMGLREEDLPQNGPEDLNTAFKSLLGWSRTFSWRGLYLFYGQKSGNETKPSFDFPSPTREVDEFLREKPCRSPWDFLSAKEAAFLGEEVADIDMRKKIGRVTSFGAGLDWLYPKYDNIVKLMYANLRAGPGYRVLVIGEVLENLGFLPELRKRIGREGEIAAFEISNIHLANFEKLWQGIDIPVAERHQWDYPFADNFPDNYFDLVWLPQGVHHARSWKEIAPRLLRVLKPQGQVMMLECRICDPLFFTGVNSSGLLRCIAEKMWWSLGVTFEEMPDYTTAELAEAFGDSLTDVFRLDPDGWLIFWGYKK